jgi:hemerythrin-like domain-containing protein
MRRAERTILFDALAGFDDPLEMLLGCHRRIEKQLETLKRLCTHVEARGVDAEASTAAQAVLRYFQSAAPNHHHDEELDLFPLLEMRIVEPVERERFRAFRERCRSKRLRRSPPPMRATSSRRNRSCRRSTGVG